MNDDRLISLNAAKDYIDSQKGRPFIGCTIGEAMKIMLDEVPPAQPDLDEWCTDCKEYDKDRHCCPRYNRVIRTALDDATPWKWTPVEDAHPIKSGPYLACSERGTVFTVFWLGNRWGTEGVIAWAELPEPYRKEGKHD